MGNALAHDNPTRGLGTHSSTVVVGGLRELESPYRALDEAVAGHGGMVTLSGEAGLGKTAIAREFVHRAEGCGDGLPRLARQQELDRSSARSADREAAWKRYLLPGCLSI